MFEHSAVFSLTFPPTLFYTFTIQFHIVHNFYQNSPNRFVNWASADNLEIILFVITVIVL